MRQDTEVKIAAAKAIFPETNCHGVLVRGGFVLSIARCTTCCVYLPVGEEARVDQGYSVQIQNQEFILLPKAVEQVCDITAMGPMDAAWWPNERKQWETFCGTTQHLEICTDNYPAFKKFPANVQTRTGKWIECEAARCSETAHSFRVQAGDQLRGLADGGPVVTNDGRLLGVISCRDGVARLDAIHRLHLCLPPWLLRTMLK